MFEVNLRHFFALLEIAELGSLSSAAERLHLSQSALTQALRRLEKTVGRQLFERAGFGVTESASGRLLIKRAQRAADWLALADRELKHAGARPKQPLKRGATASQLRALIAVVETGGYSIASRRLGLTQPSVHKAAKDLEAIVGLTLFPRKARGVEPTEVARSLARFAALMFGEIRQGFEEVRERQGTMSSRVAVGCLPLARSGFIADTVTQLLDVYPDARVKILDGPYVEQLHALRYGHIDWLVGALREPPPVGDVVESPLFQQPLAVVVRRGHPLLQSDPPTAQGLAALDWVAPRELTPARRLWAEFFEREGVEVPPHVIECGSLIATLGLIQQSDRAALLSPLQAEQYVEAGQLAFLVKAIKGTHRSIGVTVRANWEPTKVQSRFGEILSRTASEPRFLG